MSPKFFVYGDVHHEWKRAQRFLEHERPERVIWIGDFLDAHSAELDTPLDAQQTGLWLKETMEARPQDIFLMGNHELAYRFGPAKYNLCGWTKEKDTAFRLVFPSALWDRFKIYHVEEWNGQQLCFTHAGLGEAFFPFGRFDPKHLERLATYTIEWANDRTQAGLERYNPLFDNWDVGPMWMRWPNAKVLDGVCQIVGHTPVDYPTLRIQHWKSEDANWNLCVDCSFNFYVVFKQKHAYVVDRRHGYERLLKLP